MVNFERLFVYRRCSKWIYSYRKTMIKSNKLNGLAINFGSGKPITVINLVKIILNILNKKRIILLLKIMLKMKLKINIQVISLQKIK